MNYWPGLVAVAACVALLVAFVRSGIGVGGLGRLLLRGVLSGLIVAAVFISLPYFTVFFAEAQGLERWGYLLIGLMAVVLAVWLFFRVNRWLSTSKRASKGAVSRSNQILLVGGGLFGLAYLLGYQLDSVPDGGNIPLAWVLGILEAAGVVGVFIIPIVTLLLLLSGPMRKPGGLYRGQFADAEALHPLRVGKRDEVPGDALLVGMVNQGTAEKPSMELLARRPGFGDQRELGHALFVYPSRKGKGLHLATQGIYWQHSMIFTDPKGEFFNSLSLYRRSLGQHVFVLDPSNPNQSNCYDPFADLGDSAESLRSAAKLILEPPPNSREPPYFAQRATNGLVAALRAAKLAKLPPLTFLYDVKRRGLAHFIRTLARMDDDIVTDNLTDFIGKHPSESSPEKLAADERLLIIWSTLNTRTADLLQPGVRAITSGCDFRARDLVLNEKAVTLFLTFRESEIEATKAFLRLTTLALITDLIRIGDTRADEVKHKLLLGFDEAGRIPIPRLPDLVSTVSSRGMSALIYVQDLSQLEATYGREHAATIRSNCDTQVYYRPTDNLTAKYVTDRAGKTSIPWLNVTTDEWGDVRSRSQTWKDREVITVSEFMQLPEGQTLSFVGNLPPLLSHRVDYRWFRDKIEEINKLNEGPVRFTRPEQQAVTYAPASPPEATRASETRTTPAPRPGKEEEPGKDGRAEAPATGSSTDPTSGTPTADLPQAQENTPKRKRARKRKEVETEQPSAIRGRGKNQAGDKQFRRTFPSGLKAAEAAFSEWGGDPDSIKPSVAAVTGGGMPYEIYTDGEVEVAVCEVRGTGHYFIATLEELGLEDSGRRAQA